MLSRHVAICILWPKVHFDLANYLDTGRIHVSDGCQGRIATHRIARLTRQSPSSLDIPPCLHAEVDELTMLIDRAPEIAAAAIRQNVDLVHMSGQAAPRAMAAQGTLPGLEPQLAHQAVNRRRSYGNPPLAEPAGRTHRDRTADSGSTNTPLTRAHPLETDAPEKDHEAPSHNHPPLPTRIACKTELAQQSSLQRLHRVRRPNLLRRLIFASHRLCCACWAGLCAFRFPYRPSFTSPRQAQSGKQTLQAPDPPPRTLEGGRPDGSWKEIGMYKTH